MDPPAGPESPGRSTGAIRRAKLAMSLMQGDPLASSSPQPPPQGKSSLLASAGSLLASDESAERQDSDTHKAAAPRPAPRWPEARSPQGDMLSEVSKIRAAVMSEAGAGDAEARERALLWHAASAQMKQQQMRTRADQLSNVLAAARRKEEELNKELEELKDKLAKEVTRSMAEAGRAERYQERLRANMGGQEKKMRTQRALAVVSAQLMQWRHQAKDLAERMRRLRATFSTDHESLTDAVRKLIHVALQPALPPVDFDDGCPTPSPYARFTSASGLTRPTPPPRHTADPPLPSPLYESPGPADLVRTGTSEVPRLPKKGRPAAPQRGRPKPKDGGQQLQPQQGPARVASMRKIAKGMPPRQTSSNVPLDPFSFDGPGARKGDQGSRETSIIVSADLGRQASERKAMGSRGGGALGRSPSHRLQKGELLPYSLPPHEQPQETAQRMHRLSMQGMAQPLQPAARRRSTCTFRGMSVMLAESDPGDSPAGDDVVVWSSESPPPGGRIPRAAGDGRRSPLPAVPPGQAAGASGRQWAGRGSLRPEQQPAEAADAQSIELPGLAQGGGHPLGAAGAAPADAAGGGRFARGAAGGTVRGAPRPPGVPHPAAAPGEAGAVEWQGEGAAAALPAAAERPATSGGGFGLPLPSAQEDRGSSPNKVASAEAMARLQQLLMDLTGEKFDADSGAGLSEFLMKVNLEQFNETCDLEAAAADATHAALLQAENRRGRPAGARLMLRRDEELMREDQWLRKCPVRLREEMRGLLRQMGRGSSLSVLERFVDTVQRRWAARRMQIAEQRRKLLEPLLQYENLSVEEKMAAAGLPLGALQPLRPRGYGAAPQPSPARIAAAEKAAGGGRSPVQPPRGGSPGGPHSKRRRPEPELCVHPAMHLAPTVRPPEEPPRTAESGTRGPWRFPSVFVAYSTDENLYLSSSPVELSPRSASPRSPRGPSA
eukprot:TRINITY_DN3258_c0_g1_i1.p1 TRINITY_DN3258_c0_g1~~TRINITY_DN3258_c0_g1_i1.p1  ORF type:complete len:967 (+),score=259.62 TRINITY_DN3258_c0_g1_i1:60-2903(+)